MQVFNVVQLKIKHRHQNEFVFIEAICVPVVCTPFKTQLSQLPVGLLIGVDYYFCFFTNKVIKNHVNQFLAKLFWVGCLADLFLVNTPFSLV